MSQETVPFNEDGALVAGARQGDVDACRQIVQRNMLEVLRTAYLLTDNSAGAWQLARDAFLTLFRQLPRLDADVVLRARLLLYCTEQFLLPAAPQLEPTPGHPLLEGRSDRYQVDDARTRVRAGLALIEPAERVALVLREFNGLSIEQVATVLEQRPDLLTTTLELARRRMRNHIDLRADESLRAALAAAAFDAPTGNLWADLEGDVAIVLQQLGARRRMLSAAIITLMLAVMLVTLVAILRDPEPDEADASEPRFVTNAVNDPAPFPTIAPPRATGTNPARAVRLPTPQPVRDVPDTLLIALQDGAASDGMAHLTTFRPQHSIPLQPLIGWPRLNREHWAPVLSPDGLTLFLSHFETQGSSTRALVSAVDSQTNTLHWQAELDRLPAAPDGERAVLSVSMAVDEDYVYLTLHYWRRSDLIQIVVLDQETGQKVNGWPVNIAGLVANDVRVLRPPDSDYVYVYAITQAQPALVGQMHIAFYGYDAESGEEAHGKTLVEAENRRVFHMYRGQITADGRSLYGTTYHTGSGVLTVQFFDLLTATVQPAVPVPFSVEGNREPVQEAVSHDGHWLYIFSPLSQEMAIVDLLQRSLLGVIPLENLVPDAGPAGAPSQSNIVLQIAPDGSRIYAIGSLAGRSSTAGVWVIDTTTWQITDHWLPQSAPAQILLSGDGKTLYVHERSLSIGEPSHGRITGIDTGTGEPVLREDLTFLPDSTAIGLDSLAGLYRKQFGRSPSIDNQQPADNRAFTSLPAVAASVSPIEVQAGDQVSIVVSFVHPFTGDAVTELQADSRYQPPGGVRAILRDESGAARDVIVELARRGYAKYHGTASVDAAGSWTLSLVNTWSGDAGQIVSTRATLHVVEPTPGFGIGSLRIGAER